MLHGFNFLKPVFLVNTCFRVCENASVSHILQYQGPILQQVCCAHQLNW